MKIPLLGWTISRKAEKRTGERANFAGAASHRLTADWTAVLLSADQATRSSLRTLRARSRQLCQDNPHAAGLQAAFKDNIIGPDGIGVNPRMRSPRGKLLKKQNLDVWYAFKEWGERGICTADGQQSWSELQRLAFGTWFSDGEAFLRKLPGFENGFGYALQMLDADQLDDSFNVAPASGQNEIVQGIEIDKWGRPLAYHFWAHHPTESQRPRKRERIDASQIIHLFIAHRPGQHRGLPPLTPVLIAMKLVDGYTIAEVTAAHIAAAQGGFFTKTGEDALTGGGDEDEETELIEMEAEPGVARKLPVGWKFDSWDPAHPNGNFGDFLKVMLRVISCGVNTSAITTSHDLSDTSYSSGRVGLIAERDGYRATQGWVGTRLVVPVYRDFLRFGSLAGAIQLPTPEASKYAECQLEPRSWQWIDPQSDMMTTRGEISMLINSPQRVCTGLGRDYEEILDEIQEAQQMCEARGIQWPNYSQFYEAPDAEEPGRPVTDKPKQSAPKKNGNGDGNEYGANRISDLLPLEVPR